MSHAPQLLTTALACVVNDPDLRLAGSGFTEMARLAESPWSVWEDICRSNADEITVALDEVIGELEAIRSSVATGDFASAGLAFDKANELIRGLRARADRDDSR
jgi:prephenate dehydrogenase